MREIMSTDWRHRVNALGRLLLPARCLLCGGPGGQDLDLCPACRQGLPWNRSACPRCGLPVDEAAPVPCGACRLSPPPFTRVQTAFCYRYPIDRLLPSFKFHGDLAAGALLASLMAWAIDPELPPQALVPVPLHRGRLRTRGYDQALELARSLARAGGPAVLADALRRSRPTRAQSQLGADARRRNVRAAFELRPGARLPAHVALVDDVMTTGATVSECARVLLAGGVQQVDVWTIARA
jgi:ComF family protein